MLTTLESAWIGIAAAAAAATVAVFFFCAPRRNWVVRGMLALVDVTGGKQSRDVGRSL
jgi:hypothetical protein